jgi:hypothetical protein
MGGNNPKSKIVSILCWPMQDRIDNRDWGNAVITTFEDGKRIEIYRAWDLHNNTLIERVVGLTDDAEAAARTPAPPSGPSASSLSQEEESDGSVDDILLGRDGGRTRSVSSSPSVSLTHEQRVAIAKEIKDAQERRGWRVGDTANQWEEELGEDFWNLYANEFGYTYPSLRNHQRVSRQIPQELRNPHLSHSHHVIVAGLSRLSIVLWLHRCEIEEWPVAEFRRQVKGTKPKVKQWTIQEIWAEAAKFANTQGKEIKEWQVLATFLEYLGDEG